jgi:hypothetical protein
LHFGRDDQGDLVLDGENIVERPVVALGPEVRSGLRVDELRSDPDPVAAPPNAPFEQIAHAKLLADLAEVNRATLVGEAGIAR